MKPSTLRNKADRLFQIWFCKEHPFCEICGKPTSCGHHLFTKATSSALRYFVGNMIPVCMGCHLGFHSARSAQFIGKIIELRGMDWFKDLMKRKAEIIKPNIKYYKEIIELYG